jgi:FlaG/FlaF family flagellin (archaellin)
MEICRINFDLNRKNIKNNLKKNNDNKAVSDIVGTILILLIAIAIFSVLYIFVLSQFFMSDSQSVPVVDIISTIEGNDIILEHRGGDTLSLNLTLSVTIDGLTQKSTVGNYLNIKSKEDGSWGIGERLVYPAAGDISNSMVNVTIIDEENQYVIMMGNLQ